MTDDGSGIRECACDELLVEVIDRRTGRLTGTLRRLAAPREHSCDYVRVRNTLIPRAWSIARRVSPGQRDARFHEEMSAAVAELYAQGKI